MTQTHNIRSICRFFSLCLLLPGILFPGSPGEGAVTLPEEHLTYDVVVVGAGSGGTMAALQAARMGARVALVEESGWIGGQMTGAAVSTMDDVRRNRSGIYGEFLARVREYYAKTNTPVNTCYWGSDTIAFEPRAGEEILYQMIQEIRETTLEDGSRGVLDVYLHCRLKEATSRGKPTGRSLGGAGTQAPALSGLGLY